MRRTNRRFSAEDQKKIETIMEREGVSRKTAIRRITGTKAAVAPAKVQDVKKAAANDRYSANLRGYTVLSRLQVRE